MITYDFDRTSKTSIKAHADKLLYKALRQVLSDVQIKKIEPKLNKKRKGHFGDIVEKYVFDKEPDNSPEPDFPEAKLELKTTPIKKSSRKGFISKERLVLGMIDYDTIIHDKWKTSAFLKKNAHLLILFYLFEEDISPLDYKFRLIKLLDLLGDLPAADIVQIQKDWETIAAKVTAGKAHELSEGDTFYLGACTKGATAEKSYRSQPNSKVPAKSRAYSLKQNYLNFIVAENKATIEKEHDALISEWVPETIESIVHNKLKGFIGLTTTEIEKKLGRYSASSSKSYYADLARAMLSAKKKKIAEFEKANVTMKTIRLKKSGTPKESMSFPAMDYIGIMNEEWDESTLRDQLSENKFLFLIYKYDEDGSLRFNKYMFWNMPYADLEEHARKVWDEVRTRIAAHRANDLPGIAFNPVCHARPHGRNKHDKAPTPYGTMVKKQSFWLNASYIREQIKKDSLTRHDAVGFHC